MVKLIMAIIIAFPFSAYGDCSKIDYPSNQCRYFAGDNWCQNKYSQKIYAYKNKCDKQENNKHFYHGCGTGCVMQYEQKELVINSSESIQSKLKVVMLVYGEQVDTYENDYSIHCNEKGVKDIQTMKGIAYLRMK